MTPLSGIAENVKEGILVRSEISLHFLFGYLNIFKNPNHCQDAVCLITCFEDYSCLLACYVRIVSKITITA